MRNEIERPGLTPDGRYWLSQRPGSPFWHRTWYDAGARQTRRAPLGVRDIREASERLAVWWVENRKLEQERPESVTLDDVLVRYYKGHGQHLTSAEQARIACRKLSEAAGMLAVSELNGQAQRDLLARLRDSGMSNGYARRTIGVAAAALNWAHTEGLIASAPRLKLPPDGEPRERVLNRAEVAAIVEASKAEDHVYRFVVLALATMSRPAAILELCRERVDLARGLVELNPPGRQQTKKYRPTVPLVYRARHVVADIERGPLITWRGQPLASIKTAWRRMVKRAGLDAGVIPYLLRHTMATEARAMGADPWELEGFLGHRRPGTSERYAKFQPDYLASAAGAIDDYLAAMPLRG